MFLDLPIEAKAHTSTNEREVYDGEGLSIEEAKSVESSLE
jgi:hypothetical protein